MKSLLDCLKKNVNNYNKITKAKTVLGAMQSRHVSEWVSKKWTDKANEKHNVKPNKNQCISLSPQFFPDQKIHYDYVDAKNTNKNNYKINRIIYYVGIAYWLM